MAEYTAPRVNPNKYENLAKERGKRESRRNQKYSLMEENRRARAKRTPKQQLDNLDFRLGKDVGAIRERTLLKQKMEK